MKPVRGEAPLLLGEDDELETLEAEVRRVANDAATRADVARLEAAIARLEARLDALAPVMGPEPRRATPPPALGPSPAPAPGRPAEDAPSHDELVLLAAAAAAFLGVPARVRSARRIAPAPAGPSPWPQQGRVRIQASHDLGVRRR
jgi:hypothetical protein